MKHILFIDDDPEIISSTRRLFHALHQDWQATFADSGADALEKLKEKVFDVVISDIRMPGMSGIELLEKVRLLYPQTVRIALSGHADRDASLRASELAHQYLVKPCPIETILAAIQQALLTNMLIPNEELRGLIVQLKTIPSQPKVYLEIMEELKKPAPSIGDVGGIVSRDVSMSAKILQLVNSAFFGLPQTVIDPAQAAVLLGLDTVRDLVLTVGIFSQFDPTRLKRLSLSDIWDHSQRTGGLAKAIAQSIQANKRQVNDAFIAGLVHDVGKLILADNLPQKYLEVNQRAIYENRECVLLERQAFGATHAQVGAYLFGLWGLAQPVVNAVASHHDLSEAGMDDSQVTLSVHVANVIDHQVHPGQGKTGPAPQFDLAFLRRLGVEDQVDAWRQFAI
jgi:HD-like signal output (HDOD) protein/CheY-like chemotaxis protein